VGFHMKVYLFLSFRSYFVPALFCDNCVLDVGSGDDSTLKTQVLTLLLHRMAQRTCYQVILLFRLQFLHSFLRL